MHYLIPFVSACLYLLGGQKNKLFRWLMGIPIGFFWSIGRQPWLYVVLSMIVCGITYFIATNFFSYGDGIIWTKLFGKWFSVGLSGFMYGLASIFVLGTTNAIIMALWGCLAFLVLKWLDDTERVKNPFIELSRGFFGCIGYFFV